MKRLWSTFQLEERHILQFIREKTDPAAKPRPLRTSTLKNILSLLWRVSTIVVDEGEMDRNPCRNLGTLLSKVKPIVDVHRRATTAELVRQRGHLVFRCTTVSVPFSQVAKEFERENRGQILRYAGGFG